MGSIKRWIGYLLLLLVLAFGVFFSLQNTARAPLDLLIVQLPERPIAAWVLIAFAVGGVCGLLISSVTLVRMKSQVVMLRRRLDKQNKELAQLRTGDLRGVNNGRSKQAK